MAPTISSVVHVSSCARQQLNALTPTDRTFIEGHLTQLGRYHSVYRTASRPAYENDRPGRPPVVELRLWPFLLLYEHAPERRALTVLHVLRLPGERPAADAYVGLL